MTLRTWLLALLLCLGTAHARATDTALAWHGKGVDGTTVDFDPAHRTRAAVLLFWATWCPYCEALMPYLQRVADAAGHDRLDVYAIDIKEDGDPVTTLRERKLSFTLVLDGDPIAERYGVKGTPALFLVDRHGQIVYQRLGGDSPEQVESALRQQLQLPASGTSR